MKIISRSSVVEYLTFKGTLIKINQKWTYSTRSLTNWCYSI